MSHKGVGGHAATKGGIRMKLKWIFRFAALVAVLALTAVATNADEGTLSLRAKLTGFQETPPTLSPSTGTFEATVIGSTLSYTLTYTKLSTPATQAHIHFGQPGVPGGRAGRRGAASRTIAGSNGVSHDRGHVRQRRQRHRPGRREEVGAALRRSGNPARAGRQDP